MSQKLKVLVGMSGGIDSSVAALLLLEAGYDVAGATLRLWSEPPASDGKNPKRARLCCSLEAVERAYTVATRLGIDYDVFDYRDLFERTVVQPFCTEYMAGRTPNPCVVCNREIKFGKLLETARSLGMDYLATGHYARVERQSATGKYLLRRGIDEHKDQSYVLSRLTQDRIRSILLPLGSMHKDDVKRYAARIGLSAEDVPESQEVCFVVDGDYRSFLTERVREASRPGAILDTAGRKIGEHRGIAFYTVGQRKGLGITSREPMYVIRIDAEGNAIVVGPKETTYTSRVRIEDVSWTCDEPPAGESEVYVQIRSMHRAARALIDLRDGGEVYVEFADAQRAVTPGQTAALYRGDMLIGGGTISGPVAALNGRELVRD